MIQVTTLNGRQIYVNAELILFVEATPDTIISLSGGERVMVKESPEEVVAAVLRYRRSVNAGWTGEAPNRAEDEEN
ncbi:MAG TPA: flagellar FlbD family protein [Chloroflexi bacterium]|jgi:flagellar protein FlbD|nr:flagellar FlbD family protein [Chloroflexota bacterium]